MLKKMMCTHLFFHIVLMTCFLPSITAHSFLLVPKADFSHFNKPECRLGGPTHSPNDTCRGPCIPKNSWQHKPDPTRTIYKRGQNVSLVWTKNNHHGGFVRFALVPEALRMNHEAHEKFAFRYACFNSDPHMCEYDTSVQRICGTQDILFRTFVQIPQSFPDGNYVLGWAWFGGLNWFGLHSYFGDYWSCADVQIKGGPFRKSYTPVFYPGENVRSSNSENHGCWAGVNKPGICSREPCTEHLGGYLKPYPFNQSQIPPAIYAKDSPYSNPFRNPYKDVNISSLFTEGEAYVTELKMIDITSETVLDQEFFRDVQIDDKMKLTFRAMTSGPVRQVDFYMNTKLVRKERHAPYLMFGDRDGKLSYWEDPILAKWNQITVVVTSRAGKSTSRDFWFRLHKK